MTEYLALNMYNQKPSSADSKFYYSNRKTKIYTYFSTDSILRLDYAIQKEIPLETTYLASFIHLNIHWNIFV